MQERRMALVMMLALVLVAPPPALAQGSGGESSSPRTPWGDPDLQGLWNHGTATPLQRPEQYAGRELLTEEEIAEANLQATTFATSERRSELSADRDVALAYDQVWWDRGLSDGRTALVVDPADGRLPALTADGQARADARPARGSRSSDNPESRNLWERCLHRAIPRLGGAYNNNYKIFQTPTHVAILHEMVHETRIIPIDDTPHIDAAVRQWLGDSRASWDGETLVVETTNFTDKTRYQGATTDLRLVERFTRLDGATLRYEVTVHDAATWTRPWTAALDLPRTEGDMYEYACHEGNYGMENLLRGARVQEREAKKTSQP